MTNAGLRMEKVILSFNSPLKSFSKLHLYFLFKHKAVQQV